MSKRYNISPPVTVMEIETSYCYSHGIRVVDWFKMFEIMEYEPEKFEEMRKYYQEDKFRNKKYLK